MTADRPTLFVDHQFASPYAMSVFVTLTEKGIPFALETVNLDQGEHNGAAFHAHSLTARVPSLSHQGFDLSESSAITEYLEELYPAPAHVAVYPSAPKDRARARQVQAWLRSDLMPIRTERTTMVVFFGVRAEPLSGEGLRAAEKLFRIADSLLKDVDANLFGAWSIADTDLALMLNRLVLNGDAVPENLAAYAKRQWSRPSVQQWVQQQRS